MKKRVVFGFLGTTLDSRRGKASNRWDYWRPTVSACWQDDFDVDEYVIFHSEEYNRMFHMIKRDIKKISPKTVVTSQYIELDDPWDFEEVYAKVYDYTKTYRFNLEKNDYYVNITTGTHVAQICLFLLTEAKFFPAKLLQVGTEKNDDERVKGYVRIIDLDLQTHDPISARFNKDQIDSQNFLKAGIETLNENYNQLISQIETVANRSTDPILIHGATGVGKTALARRIYQLKKERHLIEGKFVEVNCATLQGDSVMSTLFGHTKGSFTGAIKDRKGLLLEADKGLIFLDEIGELGLDEQAMLLRAIEEKKFLPLGSDTEKTSDFQLLAGTNKDLDKAIKQGKFREDLYNRINLWSFNLPTLKDRKEDIIPNIEFELDRYASRTGKRVRFTTKALQKFTKFSQSPSSSWNGNFRDLNAAITRMGTLSSAGKIEEDIVDLEIKNMNNRWHSKSQQYHFIYQYLSPDQVNNVDLFDKPQLNQVLKVCHESKNMADAGKKLFQASRLKRKSTNDSDRLKKYLNKFGIEATQVF